MRLIKMFGLAALAAVAAMAFVGVTSASATKTTQLCTVHTSLDCVGNAATSAHMTLVAGTVLRLLAGLIVLCLGELWDVTPLALGKPQDVHFLAKEATGCGTNSQHDNCTLTVEELPLATLLKTGLDTGSLEALNGSMRLVCGSFIDCLYDLDGSLSSVGAQHFTMSEMPLTELGGDFFCPNTGKLDGLLKTLENENRYVLR